MFNSLISIMGIHKQREIAILFCDVQRYTYSVEHQNISITPKSLIVQIPQVTLPSSPIVFTGKKNLGYLGQPDETYFMIHDFPKEEHDATFSTAKKYVTFTFLYIM
jgi:hypothetical protein